MGRGCADSLLPHELCSLARVSLSEAELPSLPRGRFYVDGTRGRGLCVAVALAR